MVDKFENIDDIIKNCPHNTTIGNNLIRAFSIINRDNYKKFYVVFLVEVTVI